MTSLNYKSCFYFLAGCLVGCGGSEALERLLGW